MRQEDEEKKIGLEFLSRVLVAAVDLDMSRHEVICELAHFICRLLRHNADEEELRDLMRVMHKIIHTDTGKLGKINEV